MTQEEERLLFTDICARTPYGVIVRNIKLNFDGYVMSPSKYQPLCVLTYDLHGAEDQGFSPIEDIRPYLRPMSSMTEEEEESLREDTGLDIFKCTVNKELEDLWATDCSVKDLFCLYSWLNEHHFDYNGLIEKGLALEAPADMYKNG